MQYTADQVDQMLAKTKAHVIGMQKKGQDQPDNYQLLLKETTVEEEKS